MHDDGQRSYNQGFRRQFNNVYGDKNQQNSGYRQPHSGSNYGPRPYNQGGGGYGNSGYGNNSNSNYNDRGNTGNGGGAPHNQDQGDFRRRQPMDRFKREMLFIGERLTRQNHLMIKVLKEISAKLGADPVIEGAVPPSEHDQYDETMPASGAQGSDQHYSETSDQDQAQGDYEDDHGDHHDQVQDPQHLPPQNAVQEATEDSDAHNR